MPVSSTVTPLRCPDCGAELKPGVTTCWMCNYRPPAQVSRGVVHPPQVRWLSLAAFIVLALAFLPACGVAFFVSCGLSYDAHHESGPGFSGPNEGDFRIGFIGAAVMGTLLGSLLFLLIRRLKRPDVVN